jgi:hypothetical protein
MYDKEDWEYLQELRKKQKKLTKQDYDRVQQDQEKRDWEEQAEDRSDS